MIIKCDNCGNDFYKRDDKVKKCKNNFCSKECRGEFKRLDLVGQTFDQLEVLDFHCMGKWGRTQFKCRCSCGKILYIPGSGLVSGNSTKCRGCSAKECNRRYVGEVSLTYFSDLKNGAEERDIPFEITQTDIWEKYLEQKRKCILSGIELTWQDGYKGARGTASVDRKESTVGYTKENIQIVHKHINIMKLNHDQQYFLNICGTITDYQRGRKDEVEPNS